VKVPDGGEQLLLGDLLLDGSLCLFEELHPVQVVVRAELEDVVRQGEIESDLDLPF